MLISELRPDSVTSHMSRRWGCSIWDRFNTGSMAESRGGHGRAARCGSKSLQSATKPSARGQTFRSFGQECPWNRSPGTLWFTGMPLPRAGGPRSTPWCRHHHFGESTVYETCLCLEVEPVRRMVLFSQRRPPEMPDQICAVLLAARVGAKTVSLHPQGPCSRDCCQPRPCGREVGGEAWLSRQVP